MKQVRPGMDLSKVVLPTFILEPRSFLDKISDYYYHADIISRVSTLFMHKLTTVKQFQYYQSRMTFTRNDSFLSIFSIFQWAGRH